MAPPRLPFGRQERPLPVVGGEQVKSLTPQDFLGPLNVYEARNAPKTVFAAGDVSLLRAGRRVAVVGSRKADAADLDRARKLVHELVSHCVTVVSGLAAGIDTVAHRTALTMGGSTIAVLGTPLDQAYPKSNAELQRRIVASDLAISQFPFGSAVRRENFVLRNRTMALICDATIVVAASETSGTQHQGWEAIRLGRPLFFLESLLEHRVPWIGEQMRYGGEPLGDRNLNLFFEHLPERGAIEDIAF
jgi:DNA processing protein